MRKYDQDMLRWGKHAEYHLVPTGKGYKKFLEERCSLEFLDTYDCAFGAKNATTRDSYVEVYFTSRQQYPNGSPYVHHWTLRNEGYARPKWVLSTHEFSWGRGGNWISVRLPDRHFQAVLEKIFTLPYNQITKKSLYDIVLNHSYQIVLPIHGRLHFITRTYDVRPHLDEVLGLADPQNLVFDPDEIVKLLGYMPIGHTANGKEMVTAYYLLRMDHDDFTWNLKIDSVLDNTANISLSIEKQVPGNLLPALPKQYGAFFSVKGK